MSGEPQSIIESLAADPAVFQQVKELLFRGAKQPGRALHSAGSGSTSESILASMFGNPPARRGDVLELSRPSGISLDQLDVAFKGALPSDREQLESIVRVTGRPPLLVQNDWVDPVISEIKKRLDAAQAVLQPRLNSVGRIDICTDEESTMVGTGWMVGKDIMITNRHVAEQFVEPSSETTRFAFTIMDGEFVDVDWNGQHNMPESASSEIAELLFMDMDKNSPDMAILRVKKRDTPLPEPLQLAAEKSTQKLEVAAIGYPANDPRIDKFVMLNYFNNIYGVKRLSPGRVLSVDDPNVLEHDCTTMGGSSGSAVVDMSTGDVVGLHFAGSYKTRNLAVKSGIIKQVLTKL